jgi:hypothetical protein
VPGIVSIFGNQKTTLIFSENFFLAKAKNADYGERVKDPTLGDTIVFARPICENNNFISFVCCIF